MRDLDMSDVIADAANDPTLDRDCEEGDYCEDDACPLRHDNGSEEMGWYASYNPVTGQWDDVS